MLAVKKVYKLFIVFIAVLIFVSYMPAYASAASTGQWQQTGSGTSFYAEFPSGYNTGSSLYTKYNSGKLNAYENSSTKRLVTTERVSYIYWHWTWRVGATENGKYNFYINDKNAGDESHASYPYFSDFESTSNYSTTDPDGNHDDLYRCGYMWRNKPDVDGSWWWYQIPVYKQTYTDYKFVKANDENSNNNGSDNSSPATSKYTPKKTSVSKCTPAQKSCKIKWKKCSGKCTGYQIRYSTNQNFSGCKKKTIKGRNNLSCKLTGLKAGTTYYYQIRCCRKVGKKTYYSAWSECKKFVTKGLFSTPDLYTYRCIKKGKYIYCGVRNKLVRVNLKTKKVKTIASGHSEFLGTIDLCVKNGYIYFVSYDGDDRTFASLYRVKMNGKNRKVLYAGDTKQNNDRFLQHFIKNNKLYYLVEADSDKHEWVAPWAGYSMNLDGSNKKLETYLEDPDDWDVYRNIYGDYERYHKECNVNGYKVIEKWSDTKGNKTKATIWIKTPNGKKIKAGSYVF